MTVTAVCEFVYKLLIDNDDSLFYLFSILLESPLNYVLLVAASALSTTTMTASFYWNSTTLYAWNCTYV